MIIPSHLPLSLPHSLSKAMYLIRYAIEGVWKSEAIRNAPYLGDCSASRGYDELKDFNEIKTGLSIQHTTE